VTLSPCLKCHFELPKALKYQGLTGLTPIAVNGSHCCEWQVIEKNRETEEAFCTGGFSTAPTRSRCIRITAIRSIAAWLHCSAAGSLVWRGSSPKTFYPMSRYTQLDPLVAPGPRGFFLVSRGISPRFIVQFLAPRARVLVAKLRRAVETWPNL
jgi:hypothetical protein